MCRSRLPDGATGPARETPVFDQEATVPETGLDFSLILTSDLGRSHDLCVGVLGFAIMPCPVFPARGGV
jgi:hypothetical protein